MKKWAAIKCRKLAPDRIERVRREAKEGLRELTLRQLREEVGKTPAEHES
jgi:hypothetical protein